MHSWTDCWRTDLCDSGWSRRGLPHSCCEWPVPDPVWTGLDHATEWCWPGDHHHRTECRWDRERDPRHCWPGRNCSVHHAAAWPSPTSWRGAGVHWNSAAVEGAQWFHCLLLVFVCGLHENDEYITLGHLKKSPSFYCEKEFDEWKLRVFFLETNFWLTTWTFFYSYEKKSFFVQLRYEIWKWKVAEEQNHIVVHNNVCCKILSC